MAFRLKLIDQMLATEITIDKFSTREQAEKQAEKMNLKAPINPAYNQIYWAIEKD